MDKVVIKSKYNKKFHYRFYSFHMFRKTASIYFYLIAVALMVYLAIQSSFDANATSATKATSWAFVVLIGTTIPFFTIGKIKGIIKRNEKERQNNYEIIEFTKAKIVRFIENVEGKIVLGWEQFESVFEFEEFFLMYIDKDRGLVIPKGDIVEGSIDTLVKFFNKNIKPGKKGKTNFKKMYKENK